MLSNQLGSCSGGLVLIWNFCSDYFLSRYDFVLGQVICEVIYLSTLRAVNVMIADSNH
jgi:hypothetical protein